MLLTLMISIGVFLSVYAAVEILDDWYRVSYEQWMCITWIGSQHPDGFRIDYQNSTHDLFVPTKTEEERNLFYDVAVEQSEMGQSDLGIAYFGLWNSICGTGENICDKGESVSQHRWQCDGYGWREAYWICKWACSSTECYLSTSSGCTQYDDR